MAWTRNVLRVACLAAASTHFAQEASAQVNTVAWEQANGTWSEAEKWSGEQVPNNNNGIRYVVAIDGANKDVLVTDSYTVDSVLVNGTGKLSVLGVNNELGESKGTSSYK